MHFYLIKGHFDRWDCGHKQYTFANLLSLEHRRQMFPQIAKIYNCKREDIYLEAILVDPEYPETFRHDLSSILAIALDDVPTTLEIGSVECNPLHASVFVDENYQIVLDDYDSLQVVIYECNGGATVFSKMVTEKDLSQGIGEGLEAIATFETTGRESDP